MKITSSVLYKISTGIGIMVIGFLLVFVTMPKNDFNYNMDVALSPVGMILARTYLNHPEMNWQSQGYIENGHLAQYINWPSLSFKSTALWFKLTNDSSIFSARLLSALLYGVNGTLLFMLLIRMKMTILVAFLSSLVFILLPTHLDYSSLIYADVWLITFWLLVLFACYIKGTEGHLLFTIFTIIGTCFNWFVIFILPARGILALLKRFENHKKAIVFSFTLLTLCVWGVQFFLFFHFPDVPLLKALSKYSLAGFFNDFIYYSWKLFKRIGSLGYEMFFLIPLMIYYKFHYGSFRIPLLGRLRQPVLILSISILLYLIIFINWFVIHRQVLFLFSILIAMLTALILTELEKKSPNMSIKGGVIGVTLCIIMFLLLPLITDSREDIAKQDRSIAMFVNDLHKGKHMKPCLFFDFPNRIDRSLITSKFAIRGLTNAYIFNIENMRKEPNLDLIFRTGMSNLSTLGMSDFDTSSVYFITQDKLTDSDLTILDFIEVNGISVNHIDL